MTLRDITGVTAFSGGRLVESALPFVKWLGGVEIDKRIAAHGSLVLPDAPLTVADVCDVDYRQWAGVDYFHASPSCKKASLANSERGETEEDRNAAQAVCRALQEMRPGVFTLENVRGYVGFDAFKAILQTLDDLGYYYDYGIYNAADYGTPQTRIRLYVRAWRVSKALPPVVPTHCERGRLQAATLSLFEDPLKPWNGWFAAIEDLLPELPETQFAQWQLKRLKAAGYDFLVDGKPQRFDGEELSVTQLAHPAPTVTASTPKHPMRAFLYNPSHDDNIRQPERDAPVLTADGANKMRAFIAHPKADNDRFMARTDDEPVFAITTGTNPHRAYLVNDQYDAPSGSAVRTPQMAEQEEPSFPVRSTKSGCMRAWLEHGRVVKLSSRCLARFQDLPDTYPLPDSQTLAAEIIGNGIAGNLQRAIALPLLRGLLK